MMADRAQMTECAPPPEKHIRGWRLGQKWQHHIASVKTVKQNLGVGLKTSLTTDDFCDKPSNPGTMADRVSLTLRFSGMAMLELGYSPSWCSCSWVL